MGKRINAPQYQRNKGCSREERRQWIMADEGLYTWWARSNCPIDKFMQDNRIQLDEMIDKLEAEQ